MNRRSFFRSFLLGVAALPVAVKAAMSQNKNPQIVCAIDTALGGDQCMAIYGEVIDGKIIMTDIARDPKLDAYLALDDRMTAWAKEIAGYYRV